MVRRIERRMQVRHIHSAETYAKRLEQLPGEADELLKDLLIGVTQFFRDPEAYEVLAREAIWDVVAKKEPAARVRIWVPGCASGEEAYSIAILLSEALIKHNVAPSRYKSLRPTLMTTLSKQPEPADTPRPALSISPGLAATVSSASTATSTR